MPVFLRPHGCGGRVDEILTATLGYFVSRPGADISRIRQDLIERAASKMATLESVIAGCVLLILFT